MTSTVAPQAASSTPPSSQPGVRRYLPGLLLACGGALIGVIVNRFNAIASPLLVAIVLGAIVANVVRLPEAVQPGLQFSGKKLLRLGIVLLGLQLSVSTVLGLGAGMIVTVVAVVAIGILVTTFIGRAMGLSPTQSLLVACGFSICGAAAVAAADGVIDADEEEVATSVALVVIFGTLMIPIVPFLAGAMGLSNRTAGLWAGASIHEVAQVVAAGGAIGGGALAVAVVVKLARVLMLAPVMAVLGWQRRREITRQGTDAQITLPPLVPLFVLGFIAMVAVRSTLPVPTALLDWLKQAQTFLLAAAMFALGCGVRIATMKKVGPKPFVLALISTVIVAVVGLAGVLLAS
ncbi:putative sulfate exporter family transporter [Calidifontibacter sp. DB0510]|uniref:Sulfate exporter family transporter n=1 Tax=Metallococcus carri TaxID=1656884 RepID=A0A967AYZ4_9MICO|nr:putative sulfate exporter family transporter [Metallococcus carri]NHN54205.1 putative sulfate exporter family transporter [Metallococcus carri]NOP36955.1 putative sulfate exporter family transporter [Calidifontibacter sp. DB2511S]